MLINYLNGLLYFKLWLFFIIFNTNSWNNKSVLSFTFLLKFLWATKGALFTNYIFVDFVILVEVTSTYKRASLLLEWWQAKIKSEENISTFLTFAFVGSNNVTKRSCPCDLFLTVRNIYDQSGKLDRNKKCYLKNIVFRILVFLLNLKSYLSCLEIGSTMLFWNESWIKSHLQIQHNILQMNNHYNMIMY